MDAQKHYQIFIVVLGTIMNSVTIAMMLELCSLKIAQPSN